MAEKKLSDFTESYADMRDRTLDETRKKANEEALKVNAWSPTMTDTTASTGSMPTSARSPLSRRRSIGETGAVDTPGYWIHIQSDGNGIPKSCDIFEVSDDMQLWWWLSSGERRTLERLPRTGTFMFLW